MLERNVRQLKMSVKKKTYGDIPTSEEEYEDFEWGMVFYSGTQSQLICLLKRADLQDSVAEQDGGPGETVSQINKI